ncbi:MAG: hypothetical protein AAFZ15_04475 [Bacteroidota bacterium]
MKKLLALSPFDQPVISLPLPNQNPQIEVSTPAVNSTKAQSNDGGYIWIV